MSDVLAFVDQPSAGADRNENLMDKVRREAYVVGEGLSRGFAQSARESVRGGWNTALDCAESAGIGLALGLAHSRAGLPAFAVEVTTAAMGLAFLKDLTDKGQLWTISTALAATWRSDAGTSKNIALLRDNLGPIAFDTASGLLLTAGGAVAGRLLKMGFSGAPTRIIESDPQSTGAGRRYAVPDHSRSQTAGGERVRAVRSEVSRIPVPQANWKPNPHDLDQTILPVATAARALSADASLAANGAGEEARWDIVYATINHNYPAGQALSSLSSGEIAPEHVSALADGASRLAALAERSPQLTAIPRLQNATLDLKAQVEGLLAKSGGEPLQLGGEHWQARPQPELDLSSAGALTSGSRFKIMPGSNEIYEVDSVSGGRIDYHHVDYQVYGRQSINANAVVYAPKGAELLSKHEPVKGFGTASQEDRRPFEAFAMQMPSMTRRGVTDYKRGLAFPLSEVDTPGNKILDIGAGAKQEFARDAAAEHWRAQIFSIDPGLALPEEIDFTRLSPGRVTPEYRRDGRRNPQPLTLASLGEALPVADKSVDAAYAMFSLPYWAKDEAQMDSFLSEIQRVVKPGAYGRIYPVRSAQLPIVERWLADNKLNLQSEIEYQPQERTSGPMARYMGDDNDYFRLTIRF